VSSLSYPEVGEARAAAGHLEALGVAHLLEAIDEWEPFVQVGCPYTGCEPMQQLTGRGEDKSRAGVWVQAIG